MHDQMQPGQDPAIGTHGEVDREGAMAKADLYKLANYSLKLFKKLQDDDQIEAWVQAKITKAADYIASVYHYLEYEMEFSEFGAKLENSGIYNEEQKLELKNKLMEAKEKLKTLKIAQAEKLSEMTIGGGKEEACPECGGSGMIVTAGKVVPAHVQDKVEKYKRLSKAMHAAHKRLDKNNNGIPDDEEFEEDQEGLKKVGDSTKTSKGGTVTKTATGIKHERDPSSYDDGGDDSDAKSGKGTKSHAKSQSAAEKKDRAPAQKQSPKSAKTWGMKDGSKFDNRDKEKAVDEMFGQGVYEGEEPKDKPKKGEKVGKEGNEFSGELAKAKASGAKEFKVDGKTFPVKEALKGKQKKLDVDGDGDIEGDDLADLRAGKKAKKVDEAGKPDFLDLDKDGNKKETMKKAAKDKKVKESTGDYSAKKAAAGKDIGKPGKNFAKIAKKAGGGEKGEKIAGAVLKNLRKESTEPQAEVIAESAEVTRIKELTQKLLG